MIRNIISKLYNIDSSINLDNNNDGQIDNITFIISGNVVFRNGGTVNNIWGELLWPHMTSLVNMTSKSYFDNFYYNESELQTEYEIDVNDSSSLEQYGDIEINNKRVYNYNVLSAGYLFNPNLSNIETLYTGVVCHEIMHIMGLMDYYSYESDEKDYESVGAFDLMGSTKVNPQYSLSYIRKKMNWLDDSNFYTMTENCTYTLYPVNSDNTIKAAVIKLNDFETDEYFMLEVRSNQEGTFDQDLAGTGLIIYRIDPAAAVQNNYMGNMYDNDEIYVYRQSEEVGGVVVCKKSAASGLLGGTITEYGNTDVEAMVNTIFYQGTDNSLLQGVNSGILIYNIIVNADNSVTFSVTMPTQENSVEDPEDPEEPEEPEEPSGDDNPVVEPEDNSTANEDIFAEGYPTFTKKSGGVNINLKTVNDCEVYILILKTKETLTAEQIAEFTENDNTLIYEMINLTAEILQTVSKDIEIFDYYIYIVGKNGDIYSDIYIKNIANTSISCEAATPQNALYILIPSIIALIIIIKKR